MLLVDSYFTTAETGFCAKLYKLLDFLLLFTHIFSAFVLLWELQIGYLSEVTPQDWLKTTECVQSLRRKFTDLFRGDQCFRHFLCDKCVDLSCPLGLVTHALSVSRGTNLR